MANIELDGVNKTIKVDSGDLTLDVPGDIILDADGAQVIFKDAGTTIGGFNNSSSDLNVFSHVQDKDIVFTGDDGGATITALTLDMSDAGKATFNTGIVTTGILNKVNDSLLIIGGGNATNAGANLTMYGGASGSAGAFRFRNGTSVTTNITANGQIECVSGGVSTPSYSFTNDANTGMTRPTTDTITLVTAGTERLRINSSGVLSSGAETTPDAGSGGITLNQGTADNEIITFKSSDIAHGITGVKQTDTYGFIEPKSGTQGGIKVGGLVEAGTIAAVEINSTVTDVDSAESGGAEGGVQTQCMKKSGTGNTGMGSDDNIFVCRNNTTKFIVKGDGELFSDQSATVGTYDEYDDAQLVRAFDLNHMQGVINSKFDKFVQYNKDDLQKAKLIGSDKKGNATSFVNITGMSRLHNGAIWQQYEKHQKLANAVYELAKAAVGEDKANEILEQNEIKLLN